MIKEYHNLPNSHSVLIADNDVLLMYMYLSDNLEILINGLYDKVFITPELYDFYMKNLPIEEIKDFKLKFKKPSYKANKVKSKQFIEENPILKNDDAFALLCCLDSNMDCIIDSPIKTEIFKSNNVHVVRPSDLFLSAALTQRR